MVLVSSGNRSGLGRWVLSGGALRGTHCMEHLKIGASTGVSSGAGRLPGGPCNVMSRLMLCMTMHVQE